ncbi:MAG: hypothetical protein GY927_03840 [bacterium]|nr:hypothetical protein [bacterium]
MALFKSKKVTVKLLLAAPVVGALLVSSYSYDALAQQTLHHVDEKVFFDKVKKIIHRSGMTSIEFQTYKQIINYWNDHPDMEDRRWLAYVMATAYHETRLRPVREGFKTSDKAARKHVRWMYNKRIISQPYHLADRETGQVYYGRGYVQLTWAQNYKKMGKAIGMGDQLYRNPDLVLNPDIASQVLFVGMLQGHFRYSKKRRPRGKQKLKLFFNKTSSNWYGARNIINGDLRKNGNRIAGYGKKYNQAIRFIAAPDKPPVVDEDLDVIASPNEGEVTPSLPDTETVVSPDVTDADTPDVVDTDMDGQTEPGDTDTDINASGEEEGMESVDDTVVDVDTVSAGEVVPTLPEEGESASKPIDEVPQSGEQSMDVLNDPAIEGPSEGDPEVLPIGVEEVIDTVPATPTEPEAPVNPVEPVEPTEPQEPVKPIEPTVPSIPDIVVEDNSWWGTIKSFFNKAGRYVWKF